MTAAPILRARQMAARRRAGLDALAIGLPVTLLLAVLGWRLFDLAGLAGGVLVGSAGLAAFAFSRIRPLDRDWLIRQLDARLPQFEDSSALLFQDSGQASGLAALQRNRLLSRLPQAASIDLAPDWSRRAITVMWAAGAALIVAILVVPATDRAPGPLASTDSKAVAGPPRITGARLRITPPAYTGLPVREQLTLDARVPQGSRIEWTVALDPAPVSAALTFPDSVPVALQRKASSWAAGRTIDAPMLYRIEAPGLARQRLSRIDVVADAPPEVRPEGTVGQLVMVRPGQTRWTPAFEATDDYGVQSAALLRITVTQGDGENITVIQRTSTLTGSGPARARLFSTSLDLAREGMAPGSDLIVQLVVSDNRAPERQTVEGPSIILRWPSDLALADGLDGLAQPVMPAYFRSQRQIIIDTEALVAQRRRLPADQFVDRSNAIGEDQAQLRLRYGQFMGEEAEGGGGGGLALPTNDEPARPALPTNDAEPAPRRPAPVEDHSGHGHAEGEHPVEPGSPEAVLAQYGHAHDTGESATLFDPGTRSTLAQALDAMWSSERALRQGRPEDALPFANRALELLKDAQQATRIFLPRIGSRLPPIDLSRRLSGDREGIVADRLIRPTPPPVDTVPVRAWRALEERPGSRQGAPLPLSELERWVASNRGRLSDALALTAAIDTVRNEPGCLPCRRRLRALLWTALEQPTARVQRRDALNERGRRYLDALE
ncbi:DUF4175 family protein [Brevundimonas variabilis]|uniref:DUF4175 domain-containing protein n=1 Tax=Brevundimonas variabilis TaxID=74312 RepID=A0A7W9CLP3_9CAUL|nr:DUF4175 family protein [Brevundimonas variabilis]MBB5747681.1 hypothetical protein [Brevundimonas variabilis]